MELTLTGASLTDASSARRRGGTSDQLSQSGVGGGGGWEIQQNHSHSHGDSHSHDHSHGAGGGGGGEVPWPAGHPHLQPHGGGGGGHSHNHSHGHGGHPGPLMGHPGNGMVPKKMPTDPAAARMELGASVKVGTYEQFRSAADALRKAGMSSLKSKSSDLDCKGAVNGEEGAKGKDVGSKENGIAAEPLGWEDKSIEVLGGYGEDGHTLAHWASKRVDDTRFLEYLTRVPGIELNLPSKDSVGMKPLHWAATEGSIPIVAMLLRHLNESLDKKKGSSEGEGLKSSRPRAVSKQSSSGLLETVPLGSSHGDEDGDGGGAADNASSPSSRRRSSSHRNLHHPSIDCRDLSGCTPLLISAQYGHADLVAFLVKRGADVDAVDSSRDSALHWAAYKGSVPVCGLLLHLGGVKGKADCHDAYGQTPLHLAALRGNVEAVLYLLEEAEMYWERTKRRERPDLRIVGRRLRRSGGAPPPSPGTTGDQSGGGGVVVGDGHLPSYPGMLLQLCDRDGKTPLDLAIKKKRTGCELVLRDYAERHCRAAGAPLPGWAAAAFKLIRQLFTWKAWKAWMGMTNDAQSGSVAPAFPFYLVLVNMTIAVGMYPAVFLPVFGKDPGRLWDLMGLHLYTLSCMTIMWVSHVLIWRTDPGTLGGGGKNERGGYLGCGNKAIRDEMARVSKRLRRQYDETLESYSEETTTAAGKSSLTGQSRKPPHPPLCHSCHLAKPLRSKHCRVTRRCVLLFDHHCPFVGATIGLYNYRYFYAFLLFGSMAILGFVPTLTVYLLRNPPSAPFPLGVAALGAYISFFCLPLFGMLLYHTQLIGRNLTTNEHQNMWRLKYLQDEYGRYRNPFDHGRVRNALGRMFPSEDEYVLPAPSGAERSQQGADAPSSNGLKRSTAASDRNEEERRDLLQNVV